MHALLSYNAVGLSVYVVLYVQRAVAFMIEA